MVMRHGVEQTTCDETSEVDLLGTFAVIWQDVTKTLTLSLLPARQEPPEGNHCPCDTIFIVRTYLSPQSVVREPGAQDWWAS